MGAAMGCIVKKIPRDMEVFKEYSHWGIIHTSWGVCKLLIPIKLDADVTIRIHMFGIKKVEEVTFKGLRSEDASSFVEEVEKRLNNTILQHAELEKKMFLAIGGRLN